MLPTTTRITKLGVAGSMRNRSGRYSDCGRSSQRSMSGASSNAYRGAAPRRAARRREADGVYRHRKSNHREEPEPEPEPEPELPQSSPDNRRRRALNRITGRQHVIDPADIRNKRRRRLTPRAAVQSFTRPASAWQCTCRVFGSLHGRGTTADAVPVVE